MQVELLKVDGQFFCYIDNTSEDDHITVLASAGTPRMAFYRAYAKYRFEGGTA